MKKLALKIWDWVSDLGVSQDHPEENLLVRLYNRMAFISILGIIPVVVLGFQSDFLIVYPITSTIILSLYIGVIVSNYFGKIYIARYFISVGSPIWINILNIILGGFYSQGAATITSMAMTYVAFRKKEKVRLGLLAYHVVFFCLTVVYVNTYSPILEAADFPYDELVVFMGGLGWAAIVLYTFDKDQIRLMENLKANNKELKNTTEELERFTYIASHDLKSPLRTIISFIGLIERDISRKNYDNLARNINFVKSGAQQMNFLVQDILELSQLNNLEKKEHAVIDLNVVFEKARQNLLDEIKEKNAIIYCEKLPEFLGNELEFLLLFQNFIQNAIKYNESEQPTVSISSIKTDRQLKLYFRDNGIGIEKEYHEHIFQFFKRLHTSKEYQGTGLGLGLCKKIISSYDGHINVDSTIGVGTTFVITFPIIESGRRIK